MGEDETIVLKALLHVVVTLLIFDDTEGGENIILKDKSGNELMFKTSEESIEITAQESLFLNAEKNYL